MIASTTRTPTVEVAASPLLALPVTVSVKVNVPCVIGAVKTGRREVALVPSV